MLRRAASLLAEGHAVGTGVLSGIGLVGTNHDLVQSTVVAGLGVVCTLLDSTLDTLIGVHKNDLLCFGF